MKKRRREPDVDIPPVAPLPVDMQRQPLTRAPSDDERSKRARMDAEAEPVDVLADAPIPAIPIAIAAAAAAAAAAAVGSPLESPHARALRVQGRARLRSAAAAAAAGSPALSSSTRGGVGRVNSKSMPDEKSVYAPLPEFVAAGSDMLKETPLPPNEFIPHVVKNLQADPEAAEKTIAGKLQNKTLLLDNRIAGDQRAKEKEEKARAKLKTRPAHVRLLTSAERRGLNVFNIDREHQRYDLYVPLHTMWVQYLTEYLALRPNVS
ncbi:hypothetical protein, variant [Capsaspora owczarzaki ATCC 30864]|nr:hypothetical protein, variant [Capsaspora owczarzaki ATCC 30864]